MRAKFFRFGPSSLDIEVVAYIVAKDWPQFLEIQEELLLGIMEVVEQADTAIALPSQTLHLAGAEPLAVRSSSPRRPGGLTAPDLGLCAIEFRLASGHALRRFGVPPLG